MKMMWIPIGLLILSLIGFEISYYYQMKSLRHLSNALGYRFTRIGSHKTNAKDVKNG